MDSYVEDRGVLFKAVFSHLAEVQEHPASTFLDSDLLKRAQRTLDADSPHRLLWQVLETGEQLLQTLQQDPQPLTRLLETTVQLIPFDDLKSSISPAKLEEGLKSPSVPVQLLCLAYLAKAADRPNGASFVASSSSLVQLLLTVWLAIDSTEVSERALETIIALLAVDSPESSTVVLADDRLGEAHGQGLMWRRIFHDPEAYALLFLWTSLRHSNHDLEIKKGQQGVTVSQARLFEFVVRVAQLDWAVITTSTLPNVETRFAAETPEAQPYGGLLRYAASDMIDSSDYLMEVLRRDFFMKLLNVVEQQNNRQVSPRLQLLLQAIQEAAGVKDAETYPTGLHL